MWREAVFVFLMLNMLTQVNAAVDKTKRSPAENSRPGKKVKTEDAETTNSNAANNTSSPAFLGNLLVVPMDGSHWVGIKAVAQEMGRRGHKVTVVMPEVSMQMGPGKYYDTVTYPVPYDKACIDSIMSTYKSIMEKSSEPFVERMKTHFSQIQKIRDFLHMTAESLLFNTSLISHLAQQCAGVSKENLQAMIDSCAAQLAVCGAVATDWSCFKGCEKGFDAVLTNPSMPVGSLLARKLGLPTINLLRGIPCSLDMKAAGCPSPPSYVPRFFTGYTDKMNFKERVVNTVVAWLEPLLCRLLYWHFDQIAYQFLGEEVSVAQVLSESDIWLLGTDFTVEFPRPIMPNVIFVGGINCDVRNPLTEDLESWVSGEEGFVVFTLGSVVSDIPEEKTAVFLEAFKQIPQKVIWRYTGQIPSNIPENVKIMKWVPQNDLLAHPGARAFVTHAGLHGVFEGLCHAVPMVMLPINVDQPDNAKRLASRGAGVILDIYSITTESLLWGLNEVINNTRYKESIQKLSALHKDRPVDPIDLSVYWTEFVMRHKGAKHLRSAVPELNWFQYFSLDVIALLASVVLVYVVLTVKCLKFCVQKLRGKRKQD